ncbi:MAG: FkbM family methyltransferase [Nonlabens sp.]
MSIKIFIAKILSNSTTGRLISLLLKGRIPFHGLRIDVSSPYINKVAASALYFKFYESAEIRFVKKYLKDYSGDIIELGGSIGVLSTLIAKQNPNSRVLSFEADKRFIPLMEKNYEINEVKNASAFHGVIGAPGYEFKVGSSNVTGGIVKSARGDSATENFLDLPQIVANHKISNYVLISDIEGAEYFLFKQNDLRDCKMLIIELHKIKIDGKLFTIEDHVRVIENLGFKIIDRFAGNIVFKSIDNVNSNT